MEVCIDTDVLPGRMTLTGYKASGENTSVEVVPANPNRVYLEILVSSAVITFGEAYNPSTNTPVPYPTNTRVVFDKIVPVDAIFMYVPSGSNRDVTIFEGTTPEEN
jgi:hypothetical protein